MIQRVGKYRRQFALTLIAADRRTMPCLLILIIGFAGGFGCVNRRSASPNRTDADPAATSRSASNQTTEAQIAGQNSEASPRPREPNGPTETNSDDQVRGDKAPAAHSEKAMPTDPANDQQPASSVARDAHSNLPPKVLTDTPPVAERFGRVRLLLMTDRTPLLMELRISVGGRSHAAVFRELVTEVQRLADVDRDGRATWKEVVNSNAFRFGQFGNRRFDNEQQRTAAIRQFDYNVDGLFDENEILAFLANGRPAGGAFSVQPPTRSMVLDPTSPTPLFAALDRDQNREISASELQHAKAHLRLFDGNDDYILTRAELQAPDPNGRRQAQTMGSGYRAGQVTLLSDGAGTREVFEAGSLMVELERRFAYGGSLGAAGLSMLPETFARLDKDQDEEISVEELTALTDVPAHLIVELNFTADAAESMAPDAEKKVPPPAMSGETESRQSARLRFVGWGDELKRRDDVSVRGTSNRLTITVAGEPITFVIQDTAVVDRSDEESRRLFAAADKDKNAYVDAKEAATLMPMLNVPLEGLDFDGDGKLYRAELKRYLRQRTLVRQSQILATPSKQDAPLFAILDANGDGRLTEREMSAIHDRLKRLDVNGDSVLSAEEVPRSLQLIFSRGIVGNSSVIRLNSRAIPIAEAGSAKTPRWFLSSDQNRDGEISRREFLGDDAQFQSLDADRDGFVTPLEAKTFATGR